MDEFVIGLISAVTGFLSGLLVPWVKWQIEKRRERHTHRRELIRAWRAAIETEKHDIGDERSSFLSSALYSNLRANMRHNAIEQIEATRTIYVPGGRACRSG